MYCPPYQTRVAMLYSETKGYYVVHASVISPTQRQACTAGLTSGLQSPPPSDARRFPDYKPRCVYRLSALRTDLHNLEINWHGHAAKARDRDGKAAPSKTPGLHSCPVCDARISGNKAAVRRLRSGTGGNGHLRSPLAGGSKWKTPRLQLPIWA
jgi:hypothetical protein